MVKDALDQPKIIDPSSIPATIAEVLRGLGPAVVKKMMTEALEGKPQAATFVMKMLEKVEPDDDTDKELARIQKRLAGFDKTIVAEIVSLLAEADARRQSTVCDVEPVTE
jgi:hypothetical protein